jgi:hypothetical protein
LESQLRTWYSVFGEAFEVNGVGGPPNDHALRGNLRAVGELMIAEKHLRLDQDESFGCTIAVINPREAEMRNIYHRVDATVLATYYETTDGFSGRPEWTRKFTKTASGKRIVWKRVDLRARQAFLGPRAVFWSFSQDNFDVSDVWAVFPMAHFLTFLEDCPPWLRARLAAQKKSGMRKLTPDVYESSWGLTWHVFDDGRVSTTMQGSSNAPFGPQWEGWNSAF